MLAPICSVDGIPPSEACPGLASPACQLEGIWTFPPFWLSALASRSWYFSFYTFFSINLIYLTACKSYHAVLLVSLSIDTASRVPVDKAL